MIRRYFSDENFARLIKDFNFLIKIIKSFKGELEFSLRDKYFNLYFRGNSAAKVTFKPNGIYRIEINKKFFPQNLVIDPRFSIDQSGGNRIIETTSKFLHPLLQKTYLNEIYSKIKTVNYSEELIFEQMLITDNVNKDEIILIDRQVTDPEIKGRIDLLALKQIQGNQYQFLVIEVKMGNNSELKDKVAGQIETYVTHINDHFDDYKSCYQKNYSQKKVFGLMDIPHWDTIEIIPGVQGMIIVGGYSGIAKEQIKILKKNFPSIKVQSFFYNIGD